MNLNLPLLSAPASTATPPTGAKARGEDPGQASDSFGEVYARARKPADEDTGKVAAKATASVPPRRTGKESETKEEETINAVALAFVLLEGRTTPPTPGLPGAEVLADSPLQHTDTDAQAGSLLNAEALAAPPSAAAGVKLPMVTLSALSDATAGVRSPTVALPTRPDAAATVATVATSAADAADAADAVNIVNTVDAAAGAGADGLNLPMVAPSTMSDAAAVMNSPTTALPARPDAAAAPAATAIPAAVSRNFQTVALPAPPDATATATATAATAAAAATAPGVNLPAATLAFAAASPKERGQTLPNSAMPVGSRAEPLATTPGTAAASTLWTALERAVTAPDSTSTAEGGSGGEPGGQPGERLLAAVSLPTIAQGTLKKASAQAAPGAEVMAAASTGVPLPVTASTEASFTTMLSMTGVAPQVAVGMAATPLPTPASTPSLPQDIGSSEWGKALSQQLLHMGKAGQESAELQLNPPGLGPLKVTLSMIEHQIQATFVSAHASVRAAVEAALPQLRATLADSGISLGGTSVSADSRPQPDSDKGEGRQSGQRGYAGSGRRDAENVPERLVMDQRRQSSGVLDVYA